MRLIHTPAAGHPDVRVLEQFSASGVAVPRRSAVREHPAGRGRALVQRAPGQQAGTRRQPGRRVRPAAPAASPDHMELHAPRGDAGRRRCLRVSGVRRPERRGTCQVSALLGAGAARPGHRRSRTRPARRGDGGAGHRPPVLRRPQDPWTVPVPGEGPGCGPHAADVARRLRPVLAAVRGVLPGVRHPGQGGHGDLHLGGADVAARLG